MKRILTVISALLLTVSINAQQWSGKAVPFDPGCRVGKLPNGLTYYIKTNKEPEKKVSFYLFNNVGSVLENDSQNGLAHFLEHMAFKGTEHFPDKAVLEILSRHGVLFGPELSAQTSLNYTTYNIDNVPVDDPCLIDTCLMVLADWSGFITLDSSEIDKERDVIIEEWRIYNNAKWRFFTRTSQFSYEGSGYAKRDIIGDPEVIKTFRYDELRSFYKQWYRPDLQAIAIVGDINVDEVEAQIWKICTSIPVIGDAKPRPLVKVPEHSGTRFLLATDPEAREISVSFSITDTEPDLSFRDQDYLKNRYVIDLMNDMMSNRISEIEQKSNPPFISGSISYGEDNPKYYNVFEASAKARTNEEAIAFEAILTEVERAYRHGFTKGELERAKATSLAKFESQYKQKDKISSKIYLKKLKKVFLTGEPFPSVDFEFEFMKQVYPEITVAVISEKFRSLIKENNRKIIIQGPEGEGINHLTEPDAIAIIKRVKQSEVKPYEDFTETFSIIREELPGSKVIMTTPLPQFSATEWILENGARVVYRKVDYEKDKVSLFAYAMGGYSMYADSLMHSANIFRDIVETYGAGGFDNVTLQKMLTGKMVSLRLGLTETTQTIIGSSTPKDFETMMQLLYLRFAKPDFNKEAYDAAMNRFNPMVEQLQNDPRIAMADSLDLLRTNYNPRTFIISPESMKRISFNGVNHLYATAFDNASRFTFFIVGNIEEEEAKAMAVKYIGSLPTKDENESWIDNKVRQPHGKVSKEIILPFAGEKGNVAIQYSGERKYIPENYLAFEVLKGVLDIVLREKIRDEKSLTYTVYTTVDSQKRPVEKIDLFIYSDCDPEKADEVKAIIYKELRRIAETGPKQADLESAVNHIIKIREEESARNGYWTDVLYTYYIDGININDERCFQNVLKNFSVNDIQKIVKDYLSSSDQLEVVFRSVKK